MSKIRIYELAKQSEMSSKELIELLNKEFGIEVKNHMSVIEGDEASIVTEFLEELQKSKDKDSTDSQDSAEPASKFEEHEKYEQHELEEKSFSKKKNKGKNKRDEYPSSKDEDKMDIGIITIPESIRVKDFCERINKPTAEVIKKLMFMGVMANVNNEISFEVAEKIAEEYDLLLEIEEVKEKEEILVNDFEDDEKDLVKRPPVVTVMGHVDHGKTSLLDYIRSAKVTSTEAGGITQHIGAYTVDVNGEKVTFLDTPGHAAFTSMRARGAQATDIAILVVAADDGVMPQTAEAINHAKAAGVPIIVAINKMDKPAANPERVKQELTEHELVSEDWGGDTVCVPVSAKTGDGIDNLLEMIVLMSEMQDLKANPNRLAKGIVVEAQLDKGRGPVATILVQNGTLKVGDSIVVDSAYGKVRAMINDKGKNVKSAGPSMPVEVLGLSHAPSGGDIIYAVQDEKTARQVATIVENKNKEKFYASTAKLSLEELFSQIQEGKVKDLNIIIKADVQGSVEAVRQSLVKLSNDEVRVRVIHGGVGAISETDVTLASASNAIIIGFNVRPDSLARVLAEKEKVEIKTYRVIYHAIDDVTAAMKGMLDPIYKEVITAKLNVRTTFKVSSVGTIAGCYVEDGKINRNNSVRVIRDGIVIFEGKLSSLKRFKDDAKEVATGFECGITIEKFNDLKEDDVIEGYTMEEIERK
ncbi:MAG: translation initiation factor IF-2 [Clostridium sp.]|uniref:translation initiation factor IF-2 n=1 Tax=Clostridium sp. TaxID=1506 RepID=UPI002FCAD804